jgi:hypothetical protein
MITKRFVVPFLLILPVILSGAGPRLSVSPGSSAAHPGIIIEGASPGTRLQLIDGVRPIGVVRTGSSGTGRIAINSLSSGPHKIRAVEWGTGRTVIAAASFTIPALHADRFASDVILATGIHPVAIASGDLDGSGFPSVILAAADGISLLRNQGGTLSSPVKLAAIQDATGIVIQDLDGDGRNDLAIASSDGRVAVLLNRGDGTFDGPRYTAVGAHPSALVSADFNGDGIPDLATANQNGNDLSILIGIGDGSFRPAAAIPAGYSPRALVVADFNGDGLPDLATANFSGNSVSILLGNGQGGFRSGGVFTTGNGPVSLVAADFEEHGATDLAVLNQIDGSVVVLRNDGAAQFELGARIQETSSPDAVSLVTGDVDGDGHADLIVQSGGELRVLSGRGDGSFAGYSTPAGGSRLLIALDDFSGDGRLDAVTVDLSGTVVVMKGSQTAEGSAAAAPVVAAGVLAPLGNTATSITLNSSSNPLTFGRSVSFTVRVTPSAATGTVDIYDAGTLVGAAAMSGGVAVVTTLVLAPGTHLLKAFYPGNATYASSTSSTLAQTVNSVGGTGFSAAVNYPTGISGSPATLAVGDFNGDGKADVAIGNRYSSSVSVFLGNGDGTFRAAVNYNSGNTSADDVSTADVNGDGKLDLLVAGPFGSSEGNGLVTVLLGNGDGTFRTASNTGIIVNTFSTVAVADFNGDGKADVVVTNGNNSTVAVALGNGDGTFQAAATYGTGGAPEQVVVGDFNGDGIPDLATANVGNNVSVLLGNGNGTFQPAVNYSVGGSPFSIAVADFNHDGKADLVTANYFSGNSVSVLLGNGNGTFQPAVNYPTGNQPAAAAVGDFNGDGNLDIAAVNYTDSTVSILLGKGDGTFQTASTYPTGGSPSFVGVGDFNGDGRADLATANYAASSMSVLLGQGTPVVTTTKLTSSLNPATYGQFVTFTATVTPTSATGNVVFKDGATTLATMALTSGSAAYSIFTLAAGTHAITATYSGNNNDVGSTSNTVFQNVIQVGSNTTTLLSSPNPSTSGQAVTLTAVVSPSNSGGTATPTGTITFLDGTSTLGTVALTGGSAALTLSTLAVGAHALTAVYGGDGNYLASSSPALTQTVLTVVCSYSLTPTGASIIGAASTGNFTVNATAGCSFTATVAGNSTGIVSVLSVNGGTVNYSVTANTTQGVRPATITVTGQNNFSQNFNITQAVPAAICTYQLAQLSQSFTVNGGSGSIGIITQGGCPWTINANSIPAFMTIPINTPLSGSGNGSVSYNVSGSTLSVTRVAAVTISASAGQPVLLSYALTQTGMLAPLGCTASGPMPVVTQVALEGRTEVVGPVTLTCTGFGSTPSITTDIVLQLNVPVTNAVNSMTNLSDATLTNGTATQGAQITGYSTLRWPAVTLKPTQGTATVTLTNVRADASMLAPPGGPGPQSTFAISGQLSLHSASAIPLTNPNLTLANAVTTLAFQAGSPTPPSGSQATLQVTYQETTAAPTGFSATLPTRLRVVVSSIPAGVQVFAPTTSAAGTAQANLFNADCSGAAGAIVAGSALFGGTYAPLTVTNGVATATWVLQFVTNSVDTLTFPLIIVNPTAVSLAGIQTIGSFGPASPAGTACSSDLSAAAVPRYQDFAVQPNLIFLRLSTSGSAMRSTSSPQLAGMRLPASPDAMKVTPQDTGSNVTLTFLDNLMNEGSATVMNATVNGSLQTGTNTITCAASGGSGGNCVGYGNPNAPQLQPGQYSCSWTSVPADNTGVSCNGSGTEDSNDNSQPSTTTTAGVSAGGTPADLSATQSQGAIVQNFGPAVQVESPTSGPVSGKVTVSGWSVDASVAVSNVQIQVDGVTQGTVNTTISRQDICNPYSNYFGCMNNAGPLIGFSFSLDTSTLGAGAHLITALATGTDGLQMLSNPAVAVTVGGTLKSIAVTPANPSIVVNGKQQFTATGTYADNSTQNITGLVTWASTAATVATINAAGLATGIAAGTSTINATLGSVSGSATLTVTNGTTVLPSVAIDQPAAGANVSGTITVSGWALDNTTAVGTAISTVQVKVDGNVVGTASYGLSRTDVCTAYPNRPGCPNVGYTFSYDTSKLTAGSHVITVSAIDSDPAPDTGSNSVTIVIGTPPTLPSVAIDTPANGATLSGTVVVSGWAIDNTSAPGTAISSVQVKIDGAVVGNASYGISRPDVCLAFPGRPNCPNVGYSFSLNTSGLSVGSHTLTVSATDSDGVPDTGSSSLTFNIQSTSPPPTVAIDSPLVNSVVSGVINVSGWAIDNATSAGGTPIASVQVSVDGTMVGNATYGGARPDVCAAFPSRPNCPNVGYSFSLNTSGLSSGSHVITVSATDTDGVPDVGAKSVTITVSTPTGPPVVYIDNPTSGAVLTGTATVSGWAIDNGVGVGTPIAGVQIKVDGSVVGSATYGTPRSDVCAAFPGRPNCPNVGFTYALDTSMLSVGSHTLSAVATDTDGVPDSGSWTVAIMVGPQPLVNIDTPSAGSVVSGTATVSGWAIDFAGGTAIASVSVKVDGNFVGNATYGTSRPDVCAVFPGRVGCPNVGYTFSLNTSSLSAGSHTLTVSAADSLTTPSVGSKTITITIAAPGGPPVVVIDNPATGASVSGTVTVSGWAVDNGVAVGTPIASVQIKVDGNIVGTAAYGTARPDVCAAYPGRPNCPNVGFTFALDTSKLTLGPHTLTAVATDTDGRPDSGSSAAVTITVGQPPLVRIDSPAAGTTISGTIVVSGWAIDNGAVIGTAIGSVQVKVDGNVAGNATYGTARPDVCAVFPSRPGCPNVGYTFSLNTATLAAGSHTITVTATDTDGVPDSGSTSVTVTK